MNTYQYAMKLTQVFVKSYLQLSYSRLQMSQYFQFHYFSAYEHFFKYSNELLLIINYLKDVITVFSFINSDIAFVPSGVIPELTSLQNKA